MCVGEEEVCVHRNKMENHRNKFRVVPLLSVLMVYQHFVCWQFFQLSVLSFSRIEVVELV